MKKLALDRDRPIGNDRMKIRALLQTLLQICVAMDTDSQNFQSTSTQRTFEALRNSPDVLDNPLLKHLANYATRKSLGQLTAADEALRKAESQITDFLPENTTEHERIDAFVRSLLEPSTVSTALLHQLLGYAYKGGENLTLEAILDENNPDVHLQRARSIIGLDVLKAIGYCIRANFWGPEIAMGNFWSMLSMRDTCGNWEAMEVTDVCGSFSFPYGPFCRPPMVVVMSFALWNVGFEISYSSKPFILLSYVERDIETRDRRDETVMENRSQLILQITTPSGGHPNLLEGEGCK